MQCTATLKFKMTIFRCNIVIFYKKMLCVIVATASLRRFKRVPTIDRSKKNNEYHCKLYYAQMEVESV